MADLHADITQDRLDANWRAIEFELDAPAPSRLERLLRTVRVPESVARVVVATPALRRSWFVALALVLIVGFGAADDADPRRSLFVLLLLAPLVPVGGVAMAYGSWADPGHELHVTTPMHGLRLLALRATTVFAVAVVLIGGFAALGPTTRPMALAWVLPALATSALATALMTVMTPSRASLVAAGAWIVVAFAGRTAADDLGAFGPIAQLIALGVAVAAGVVAWLRRERLDVMIGAPA